MIQRVKNNHGVHAFLLCSERQAAEVFGESLHYLFRLGGDFFLLRACAAFRAAFPAPADNGCHQPPHQGKMPRAHGRTADVMMKHKVSRVRLALIRDPVGEQRGFSPTRFSQHGHAATVCAAPGKGVEFLKISVAAHVELRAAAFGVGFMVAVFARPHIGHLVRRELRVNCDCEVSKHQGGKTLRVSVGVTLAQGDFLCRTRSADFFFELSQLIHGIRVL